MAFGTNLWNDVHQIYHLGYLFKKNKIKETKLKRGESEHFQPIWTVNFSLQLLARKQASYRSVTSKF